MGRRILRRLWFNKNPDHDTLLLVMVLIVLLIGIGAIVFYHTEDLSRFDSLYFAMMSISTIGYGDIVPTAKLSKVVIMIYSLIGVPLFIYTAGLFVELRLKKVVTGIVSEQKEQLDEIGEELEEIGEDLEKVEKRLKKKNKPEKNDKKSFITKLLN